MASPYNGDAMNYTLAVVNAIETHAAIVGTNGLKQLVDAGITTFDFRLPETIKSAQWAPMQELASDAYALGARIVVHSWEGRFDGVKATADKTEGAKDAKSVCERIRQLEVEINEDIGKAFDQPGAFRVFAYRGNFERDVWRGPEINGKRLANPLAHEYVDAFLTTFYGINRTAQFHYLGFANPDRHYSGSDLNNDGVQDDVIPADWANRVQMVAIMAYQSTASSLKSVIDDGINAWGGIDAAICVGVGRIDKSQGQVGSPIAIRQYLATAPASVVEVVFYVGNGASGQILKGHSGFPALVNFVPTLSTQAVA